MMDTASPSTTTLDTSELTPELPKWALESQCIMPATYNSDGCYICYLCDKVGLTEEEMVEHVQAAAAQSSEHQQRTRASRQELCQQWRPRIQQLPLPHQRKCVQERLDAFVKDANMDMDRIQERYAAAEQCLQVCELQEGMSLLELAVWKNAMRGDTVEREEARVRSGVDVVLGNVVEFL